MGRGHSVILVIARSVATKQSSFLRGVMDCFASLAMTGEGGCYLLTLKNSFSSVAASVSPTPEYTSGT
jgi:hypothetical protein